jgi:hypothetical protein
MLRCTIRTLLLYSEAHVGRQHAMLSNACTAGAKFDSGLLTTTNGSGSKPRSVALSAVALLLLSLQFWDHAGQGVPMA